jgi:hypothetical protein
MLFNNKQLVVMVTAFVLLLTVPLFFVIEYNVNAMIKQSKLTPRPEISASTMYFPSGNNVESRCDGEHKIFVSSTGDVYVMEYAPECADPLWNITPSPSPS